MYNGLDCDSERFNYTDAFLTYVYLDRGGESEAEISDVALVFGFSHFPINKPVNNTRDLPLPTFHFDCKHRPEDIDGASLDRGDAGASRKDFAAAGWLQPRSTFQSRNRSSRGSRVVRGSRKGDSVWVVALSGREPRSFSSPRWLSRMEDR